MQSTTVDLSTSQWLAPLGVDTQPFTLTLDDAIELYVQAGLQTEDLQPNTIRHYQHDLQLFRRHVLHSHHPDLSVDQVTAEDVEQFLEAMRTRGNAPSSRRRRLAALKRFFATMLAWGYVHDEPTALLHAQPTVAQTPVTLSLHQSLQLLEAAKTTRNPLRDHAMFRLFLTSGCTLSELIRLRRGDIDLSSGRIRFCGRRNIHRTLVLSEGAREALDAYLRSRSKAPADPHALFLNRHGKPVTKGAIYHAFHMVRTRAGITRDGLSVHSLRHTCIALLWRAGVSLQILQKIAGHQSLATTREYEWAGERPTTPRPWHWIHPIDEALGCSPTPLE